MDMTDIALSPIVEAVKPYQDALMLLAVRRNRLSIAPERATIRSRRPGRPFGRSLQRRASRFALWSLSKKSVYPYSSPLERLPLPT
jgi:hypothetical protein